MVKPGVNQVDRIPRDCRNARMRDDARAPNSPRERAVGVVRPRAMKPDMVSKSKVRQTMWRGTAGPCVFLLFLPPARRESRVENTLKRLLENDLAVVLPPDLRPTVATIKPFRAGARFGRKRSHCVAAITKHLTRQWQQGASEAAPLVGG